MVAPIPLVAQQQARIGWTQDGLTRHPGRPRSVRDSGNYAQVGGDAHAPRAPSSRTLSPVQATRLSAPAGHWAVGPAAQQTIASPLRPSCDRDDCPPAKDRGFAFEDRVEHMTKLALCTSGALSSVRRCIAAAPIAHTLYERGEGSRTLAQIAFREADFPAIRRTELKDARWFDKPLYDKRPRQSRALACLCFRTGGLHPRPHNPTITATAPPSSRPGWRSSAASPAGPRPG